MTLWKKNWLRKKAPEHKETPDHFRELKKEIAVIRRQGESPVKDPHTFSQYICDLCTTPLPVSDLRQCVLCGRWACDACWNHEYYTCKSCTGLLKIRMIQGND